MAACGAALLGAATVLPGCNTTAQREQSVRPGVNDPYKNANVAEWTQRFESESREIYASRGEILQALGVRQGMDVADIGAGTGLFTLPLARDAAPGRVYAVDIVPEFLAHIEQRAAGQGIRNVQTVAAREDSIALAPGSIDLAFLCDTYHHLEYPRGTLASIYAALRPGGEMVVIDFKRIEGVSRSWVLEHVRASQEQVVAEITAAGFVPAGEVQLSGLRENYFVRFRKPA